MDMETNQESRHQYFVRRLKELGLYDDDADYDGMIGTAVEELSTVFEKQGHSGGSASITMALFNKLINEWDTGEALSKHRKSA